ncbi:LOW QUALITY PROTEIN: hypothetical protein PHMEG_00030389 [Phytophthora megakarya]|uniref:Uncharacterized protein n=1 Tax=Phytophthora megakarya TaxID=4795 RepID=A0A225V0N3_9STRA|nr:LOW QUALITY PROTEIN: hypothetical protein PHMEG_00030389 [Phytophthora megakarya]
MTWCRLLREARAGRESARLVRDALVTRLSDMVTAVGGSLDVTQLLGEPGRGFDLRDHASSARPRPRDRTCSGHALWTPRVDRLSFDYSVNCGSQLFCSLYRGRVDIYGSASILFSAGRSCGLYRGRVSIYDARVSGCARVNFGAG